MPSPVLAVDCGAGHAVCGSFAPAAGGKLILQKFAFDAFQADPAQDGQWINYIAQALKDAAHRAKIHGPAIVGAPGHLTLTKLAKTPSVDPAKRAKIIEFEAGQNIPYPLSEVVWDHLPLSDDGVDLEVLLAAVKIDVARSICDDARLAGFPPTAVEPECVALYHGFRHNYPEVDVPVLLIEIGARSTHLAFIEPKRVQLRTIGLAGNTVTQSIADEMKEDFAEAEAFKVQALAGQVALAEGSPALVALTHAVHGFIGRLHLEITRSIVNYRRQTGAEQPAAIFLTGGGSLLPDLQETLAEKLRMQVEIYDPLRRVEVAPAAAEAANFVAQLAGLVGLATGAIDKDRVHMNLLPPDVRQAQQFRKRQPFIILGVACAAAALAPAILHYQSVAEAYRAQVGRIETQIVPLRTVDRRIRSNLDQVQKAREQITSIEGLVRSKSNWLNFFNDLQQRLTEIEDVWLERLQVVREGPAASGGEPGMFGGAPEAAPPVDAEGNPIPPTLRLNLSGRLLDRNNPVSRVSSDSRKRVSELLQKFTESQFISAVENERFDANQPGILQFDFVLVVDPKKPL